MVDGLGRQADLIAAAKDGSVSVLDSVPQLPLQTEERQLSLLQLTLGHLQPGADQRSTGAGAAALRAASLGDALLDRSNQSLQFPHARPVVLRLLNQRFNRHGGID